MNAAIEECSAASASEVEVQRRSEGISSGRKRGITNGIVTVLVVIALFIAIGRRGRQQQLRDSDLLTILERMEQADKKMEERERKMMTLEAEL